MAYEEKGQVANISGLLISLAIGIGVFVIINVFMGTLGGETYSLVEDDILALGDNNASTSTYGDNISGYIQDSVAGSFEGMKTLGEYTPLIVLSVVIFLVLILVTQFTGTVGGAGGGSVL